MNELDAQQQVEYLSQIIADTDRSDLERYRSGVELAKVALDVCTRQTERLHRALGESPGDAELLKGLEVMTQVNRIVQDSLSLMQAGRSDAETTIGGARGCAVVAFRGSDDA